MSAAESGSAAFCEVLLVLAWTCFYKWYQFAMNGQISAKIVVSSKIKHDSFNHHMYYILLPEGVLVAVQCWVQHGPSASQFALCDQSNHL